MIHLINLNDVAAPIDEAKNFPHLMPLTLYPIGRMPKIVHVAVKYGRVIYSLPAPNRHHHVIRKIGGMSGPHEEGFLLDNGEFLGRRDAMQLAKDNGQLKRKPGNEHYQGDELYSEDLW